MTRIWSNATDRETAHIQIGLITDKQGVTLLICFLTKKCYPQNAMRILCDKCALPHLLQYVIILPARHDNPKVTMEDACPYRFVKRNSRRRKRETSERAR